MLKNLKYHTQILTKNTREGTGVNLLMLIKAIAAGR